MKKIFLISFLLLLFLFPIFIQAGLVPCGQYPLPPCELCHLFVMLARIVDFVLLTIVLPVATLLLVISGGMLLLSAGDPGKITQGRSILFSTVIGLVIIFSAWLLISLFLTTIGVADWTGLRYGWFEIYCP